MNIINYNKPRIKLEKFRNSNYSTMTNVMNRIYAFILVCLNGAASTRRGCLFDFN